MKLIEWQSEFSVGVASVDHEHQELIDLINTMHNHIQADASQQRIVDTLGDIYAQIAAHFALEEKQMRDHHYKAYPEHKEDHETLLDDLRDIMDEVDADGYYDQAQLSQDLRRWFSEHFATHDAKLHTLLS